MDMTGLILLIICPVRAFYDRRVTVYDSQQPSCARIVTKETAASAFQAKTAVPQGLGSNRQNAVDRPTETLVPRS